MLLSLTGDSGIRLCWLEPKFVRSIFSRLFLCRTLADHCFADMFGGGRFFNNDVVVTSNFIILDTETYTLQNVKPASPSSPWPTARWSHAATLMKLSSSDKFIFISPGTAGLIQYAPVNDAWFWQVENVTWAPVRFHPPPPLAKLSGLKLLAFFFFFVDRPM